MTPILFCLLAAVSTYLGGIFALRYVDKNHLLSAWASGAILSVGIFDLLLESIHLTGSLQISFGCFVIGLFGYHIVNNLIPLIFHKDNCDNIKHKSNLATISLCIHSIVDGLIIGLSFKISFAIGLGCALAILAHDMNDGLNIVLKSYNKILAIKWLILDALAPICGVLLTFFIQISNKNLGYLLGIFSAFFVYISMSSLITESHHNHPKFWNILLTIFGALFMFFIIKITG